MSVRPTVRDGCLRTWCESRRSSEQLHGTLAYTGMDVLPPLAIPSADFLDEDGVRRVRDDLAGRLEGIFTDASVPYRPQFAGDYTEEWYLKEHVLPGETGLSIHVEDSEAR